MPFQSEAQRRYLWSEHPAIAKKWAQEMSTPDHKAATHKKIINALAEKRRG